MQHVIVNKHSLLDSIAAFAAVKDRFLFTGEGRSLIINLYSLEDFRTVFNEEKALMRASPVIKRIFLDCYKLVLTYETWSVQDDFLNEEDKEIPSQQVLSELDEKRKNLFIEQQKLGRYEV